MPPAHGRTTNASLSEASDEWHERRVRHRQPRSSSHVSNTPRSTTSTIPGAEQAREEVLA
ncbi:hypothetical protein L917_15308 [Phytophthora nicotianae]|uniref:Uncharacterized protein n=1 Tax=Phytophthora nicotianae TaxID=4792 RepID=W2KIG9_PHYNI|nr:hypothetical protein L917_15308 [Phytophthora nicotianae]